uniref:Uncharacterized protein n=1 Tax=Cucumis melo TaxID=3656 RepID=A0A9I9ELE4_CUCME
HFSVVPEIERAFATRWKSIGHFSIVLGCTLVIPQTSSLPNLYFGKMCVGRC